MPPSRPFLVALERVDVTLAGARVLAEVSLVVHPGEGVGIVGANGSGKSTLLRVLRGEQWPDPAGPGRRLFALDGDAPHPSPIGARARIGLVSPESQDAYARHGWDLPVEAAIRAGFFDALWPEAPATAAQAARIREVAGLLGIAPLLGRSVLALSRGEARRVLLARALAPGPSLLLLDEVCDGLDRAARDVVLADVARVIRTGTAVVMVTHRKEELVAGMTVLRMERGRLVPHSSVEHEHEHENENENENENERENENENERENENENERENENENEHEHEHENENENENENEHEREHEREYEREYERRDFGFWLQGVSVHVGGRPVLCDLTWSLPRGESCAIVGPNGAGKSTLLRLLAAEEHPRRGHVRRLDLAADASLWDVRRRIALLSPELQARHALPATAEEIVLSGFEGTVGLAVAPTAAQRGAAAAALEKVGCTALASRAADTLSYGELRKVLLARALAPGPEVLLLDEPGAGLDPAARAWMRGALDALVRDGRTVVLVTHHDDEIPPAIRRIAGLEAGRVVWERGRPDLP
jgi:molybdate transport system ATP-binding protein